MLDFIEKVVYINLEHRTDRKEAIERELLKVFPAEKIVRFNAIKHEKGGIGCSMSHIGALELAIENKWKNVLIVEDDMEWQNFEHGKRLLSHIIRNKVDVLMLSGHEVKYNIKTYRLQSCCARTAYLVLDHYYPTLLNNFKNGVDLLQKEYTSKYRGDRYWNRLQEKDSWYIIMPQICIQKPSFSDIEKRDVNYKNRLKSKTNILDRILSIKVKNVP